MRCVVLNRHVADFTAMPSGLGRHVQLVYCSDVHVTWTALVSCGGNNLWAIFSCVAYPHDAIFIVQNPCAFRFAPRHSSVYKLILCRTCMFIFEFSRACVYVWIQQDGWFIGCLYKKELRSPYLFIYQQFRIEKFLHKYIIEGVG